MLIPFISEQKRINVTCWKSKEKSAFWNNAISLMLINATRSRIIANEYINEYIM